MDALSNAGLSQAARLWPRHLGRPLLAAVLACLAAAALLLVTRRLAGGLHQPLTVPALAITGLLLATVGALIRQRTNQNLPSAPHPRQRPRAVLLSAMTTLAILALAGAVSLPDTPRAGLLALWIPIVVGECGWLVHRRRQTRPTTLANRPQPCRPPAGEGKLPQAAGQPGRAGEPLPKDISQHIQRTKTKDQRDSCCGWVRADFQPRQRTETIHLAFCPPFLATPSLAVQQLEGPDLQVKTAQVLPYGARLELRLNRACDEPVQTTIGFTAVEGQSAATE
ncbi:MAG: hypothetical protein GTO53_01770 [Planctomycetales bacterium]|nr:hypothetical protein [Planctomycetales bacterium]NIM07900.1 hypothetical protein [Planctomycetales bacterium]NIN07387.1 hypothetical protein [Planctomycetales bacterium]NIN76491.1 hypothetical protein [Planctomycetales bacterium]NIO33681.1 hypothetical protein [Planctomycetales bacterium]